MNERSDLIGCTVIITGGGKGIGRVYSQEFAKAGARVVAADVDGAAATSVTEALIAQGSEAVALTVDISSEESTKAMAQAALDHFGAIDVLINNASLMSVLPRCSWLDISVDEWDRVMAVNLRGMFLCCRAVFPSMKARGPGKIVNISSSRVWEGTPNRLHYTTSKAGVIGFTRALAREIGGFGITVNAVTPGMTQSETQVQSSAGNYLAARRWPSDRARPGAGRLGGNGDVSLVTSQRFHHWADYQRRWRQNNALGRHATILRD
jgi:3-oxoacyl-[acyl-carrier protein] reductase